MKNDIETWSKLIKEQRASGASARQWCGLKGISEHKFIYWRRKLEASSEVVKFTRVDSEAPVELVIDDRLKLRVSISQLGSVIKELCDASNR